MNYKYFPKKKKKKKNEEKKKYTQTKENRN